MSDHSDIDVTINPSAVLMRITQKREEIGLSEARLAEMSGAGHSVFTDMRRRNTVPKIERLMLIAKTLNVTLDWLCYGRLARRDHPQQDSDRVADAYDKLTKDQQILVLRMLGISEKSSNDD